MRRAFQTSSIEFTLPFLVMDTADDTKYFDEDAVFIRTATGVKCGIVVESYIDAYSDEEDGDNQENIQSDDEDQVRKGYVRIAWYPDGERGTVRESDVSGCSFAISRNSVVGMALFESNLSFNKNVTNEWF